jgi:hypothetical protein
MGKFVPGESIGLAIHGILFRQPIEKKLDVVIVGIFHFLTISLVEN